MNTLGNTLGTRREHIGNNKNSTPTPFQIFSFDNFIKKRVLVKKNSFSLFYLVVWVQKFSTKKKVTIPWKLKTLNLNLLP
jgi:hypothetical protein